jgi:hypothetical protein
MTERVTWAGALNTENVNALQRRLVPLSDGELADNYPRETACGLELPTGMREETDAELRARVLAEFA